MPALISFALLASLPASALASRPFLYYQSGTWINKVALTPKHRPRHVVNTGSGALTIATGARNVFWTTISSESPTDFQSSIMAASAGGGGVRTVVSGLPITTSMVASHGYLYWPDEAGIGRVALDGSQLNRDYIPLPEEEGGGVADGLAISGHYLYFSRCQDGSVGRVDLKGLSVDQYLVSMPWPACPQALTTAGGHVYWAQLGDAGESYGRIGSARLNGADPDEAALVINSEAGPFSLTAGNGFIYWSWGGVAGSPNYVARARLDGRRANSQFAVGGSAMALMAGSRHQRRPGDNKHGRALVSARAPEVAKRARSRYFPRCIPPHYGEPGRVAASAPPRWNCRRLRVLWDHAGDPAFTFRLFGHRWQCLPIARPDHGRHTTLGCFHVHWKFDPEYKRPPGKPVVRFFLPYGAS